MKNRIQTLLVAVAILAGINRLAAQGTAFIYQGRLNDGTNPVNGSYDLQFTLYTAATNGNQAGSALTNSATAINNGLFSVALDFGNQFDGTARWLEIGVRTNGNGTFNILAPRQPLLAVPYAVTANTASNLSGTLPVTQLSGTVLSSSLPASPEFSGTVTASSFSGNGAGITNVPGALTWQTVQGTNVQARPNMGYLLTNDAPVTVTLPAALNVGDVVRIVCLGGSGWSPALNQGQAIVYQGDQFVIWNGSAIGHNWTSVASSADGSKLVAVQSGGQIYTSNNGGTNWIPTGISGSYTSVASSADGNKLVAVGSGNLTISADGGVTWSNRYDLNLLSYFSPSVASSADGSKLVVVGRGSEQYYLYPYYVYTSTDSGTNWTMQQSFNGGSSNPTSIASSADGNRLVALFDTCYTSTDGGTNWTPQSTVFGYFGVGYDSVASSTDGSKLVAAMGDVIFTSTNGGTNWAANNTLNGYFASVASSADGSKLVAVGSYGPIYTSSDSGATWNAADFYINGSSVASSADGSKLVATATMPGSGLIYLSTDSGLTWHPSKGPTSSYSGAQYSAIELQYVGNGVFLPISHEGSYPSVY